MFLRGCLKIFNRGVFYVHDGDGNIVRSIDISGKKEYNYEYEEGSLSPMMAILMPTTMKG